MKFRNTFLVVAASMLFIEATFAADPASDDHAAHHPVAASSTAPSPSNQMPKGQVAQGQMPMMNNMQEHMQKMQELMLKIQQAKTPEEHQKLMQEHMGMMQSGMVIMRNMNGMGMIGNGNMVDGKPAIPMNNGQMNPGVMCNTNGANVMEQRLEMMQQMMDQMLQHQAAEKETK